MDVSWLNVIADFSNDDPDMWDPSQMLYMSFRLHWSPPSSFFLCYKDDKFASKFWREKGTANKCQNHITSVIDDGGSVVVWGFFAASGPGWFYSHLGKTNSKFNQETCRRILGSWSVTWSFIIKHLDVLCSYLLRFLNIYYYFILVFKYLCFN